MLKEIVAPRMPALDQLKEGLKLYGLLNLAKENSSIFCYVFVDSSILSWTYDKFEEFVEPEFSEHGSSQKHLEVTVFKAFMDAMECIFLEG